MRVMLYITLEQWLPTFFDLGPHLVCWRAWGATTQFQGRTLADTIHTGGRWSWN